MTVVLPNALSTCSWWWPTRQREWTGSGEGNEGNPVIYPSDWINRVEGTDDLYYDTAVLTEEVGSRNVDDDGHVLQEPELVRRMVTEVKIY
ncbi:hypothetical protein [Halosimplex halobium]|uniref:hypothetical protein n=1 Tax=Halosimplex halobium TaxID=3396618 RepID=UPI003F550E42